MNILLIEDNDANARTYMQMLTQAGFPSVDVCATGLEGLQAAQRQAYAAVFIDLDLPDVDGLHVGLALAHAIRVRDRQTCALIALTARADAATLEEAQGLGFDAFIRKPCTRADLETALEHLVVKDGHKE